VGCRLLEGENRAGPSIPGTVLLKGMESVTVPAGEAWQTIVAVALGLCAGCFALQGGKAPPGLGSAFLVRLPWCRPHNVIKVGASLL